MALIRERNALQRIDGVLHGAAHSDNATITYCGLVVPLTDTRYVRTSVKSFYDITCKRCQLSAAATAFGDAAKKDGYEWTRDGQYVLEEHGKEIA